MSHRLRKAAPGKGNQLKVPWKRKKGREILERWSSTLALGISETQASEDEARLPRAGQQRGCVGMGALSLRERPPCRTLSNKLDSGIL